MRPKTRGGRVETLERLLIALFERTNPDCDELLEMEAGVISRAARDALSRDQNHYVGRETARSRALDAATFLFDPDDGRLETRAERVNAESWRIRSVVLWIYPELAGTAKRWQRVA